MLSTNAEITAEATSITTSGTATLPPVAAATCWARRSMTPVFASAPTRTKMPAKNASVSHSTASR